LLKYPGSAIIRSRSPAVRDSSAASASAKPNGSTPSVRRSFQCEYARSTGSRSNTTIRVFGITAATRDEASGWNM
jgi:hypothetical protein